MAALAIWCSPLLESTFIDSAYHELSESCTIIKESNSKRCMGIMVGSSTGTIANIKLMIHDVLVLTTDSEIAGGTPISSS